MLPVQKEHNKVEFHLSECLLPARQASVDDVKYAAK